MTSTAEAGCAPRRPADPLSAVIWPGGARLHVEERLIPTETPDGVVVEFLLPGGASLISAETDGATQIRRTLAPCALPEPDGRIFAGRAEAILRARRLEAGIAGLEAELKTLTDAVDVASPEDLEKVRRMRGEAVPALRMRIADLRSQLLAAEELRRRFPDMPRSGWKVSIRLDRMVPSVLVRYDYGLDGCGWTPRYVVDARPAADGGSDAVRLRLEAEIWQHSGMDWHGTSIILRMREGGDAAPHPLPEWVLDAANDDAPRHEAPLDEDDCPCCDAMPEPDGMAAPRAADDQDPAIPDASIPDACWTVSGSGLGQEPGTVLLRQEDLEVSLTRVARPTERDGRVWLTARFTPAPGDVWPDGPADFLLDGMPAGRGRFRVEDGGVDLFFGPDPLVSVSVSADVPRVGMRGVVQRRRQWDWAWIYVVRSGRRAPVSVRLERPMPRCRDRSIVPAWTGTPEPEADAVRGILSWTVDVPAGGTAEVRHAVNATAPVDGPAHLHDPEDAAGWLHRRGRFLP